MAAQRFSQMPILSTASLLQRVAFAGALLLMALPSSAAPQAKTAAKNQTKAQVKASAAKNQTKAMTLEMQLQHAISYRGGQSQKAIRLLDQGADANAQGGALFRQAVAMDDDALVRAFLRHGAKVTPQVLENALWIENQTSRVAEILLNHGADPNAVAPLHEIDDEGRVDMPPLLYTPLMVAAHVGNTHAAKLLLERGARINTRLDSRFPNGSLRSLTALGVAARSDASRGSDDLALCKFLLNRGADFRGAQEPLLQWAINKNDLAFFDRLQKLGALPKPLIWPAFYDKLSLPMAKRMIAAGAKPNVEADPNGFTSAPLWIATFSRDWPLTQFLLEQGARIEPPDLLQALPAQFVSPAQKKQQDEALKRAQTLSPGPFEDDSDDPEMKAEAKERLRLQSAPEDLRWLDLFLGRGADPNQKFERMDGTLLHIAALHNRKGAIKSLVRAGAHLEARDGRGRTPLHSAVESMADEAVPALLDAGADLEARDGKGQTPLMLAAAYGGNVTYYAPFSMSVETGDSTGLVSLLLARGADVKATDSQGGTALHFAAGVGNVAAVRVLLEKGAVIEAVATNGTTPLGSACAGGKFETVRLLLERGANPDFAGAGGKTPRQIALEPFHPKMEIVGGGKLSPREEKESQGFMEAYATPIRAGRKQIAALFRKIPTTKP